MTILYEPHALFSLEPLIKLDAPKEDPKFFASSLQFLAQVQGPKSEALKQIIAEHGWPTSENSDDYAQAGTFNIVLHSDYDLDFQITCHGHMLERAEQGIKDQYGFLAFVTDRILCNKGLHQRFGTQIREAENGCFVPKPIENPENVDALREQVALEETQFDYMHRINSGDLLLYRPLVGEYADEFDNNTTISTETNDSTVLPFEAP